MARDGEGDGIGCGRLGRLGYEVQLGSAFSAGSPARIATL
jgi:hypothetical protein